MPNGPFRRRGGPPPVPVAESLESPALEVPASLHMVDPASTMTPPKLGRTAARGILITVVFTTVLEVARGGVGLFTARYLNPADFAVFGAAVGGLLLASQALNFEIGNRLVQMPQDSDDAIDYGFTFAVWLGGVYIVFALIAGPILAHVYGQKILIPICLVLSLQAIAMPGNLAAVGLSRRLAWWRLRLVGSIGPLVALLLTLDLAVSGAGVWALVIGQTVGTLVSVAATWLVSPRRPRLRSRVPREMLRFFLGFGWPLWLAGLITIAATNGIVYEISIALGLAALGYFRVTVGLGERIDTAEHLISSVMYPVICRISDEASLRRAFDVSGRLVLVWAVPTGAGLALFARDIATFVLGARWQGIVPLLRVEGIAEVANAIGTLWTVFYLARGENRPALALGLQINLLMLLLIGVLGKLFGYPGIVATIAAAVAVGLVQRRRYVKRLFPGIGFLRTALPSVSAGLGAVALVLALNRVVGSGTLGSFALRVVAFLLAYTVLVALFERNLVAEARGLLRG